MDFLQIFNTQFLIYALLVYVITYVVNLITKTLADYHKFNLSSIWYQDLVKPVLPILVGAGISYNSHQLTIGLVAALFSGLIYRIAKSFLYSQIKPSALFDQEEGRKSDE